MSLLARVNESNLEYPEGHVLEFYELLPALFGAERGCNVAPLVLCASAAELCCC